MSKTSLASRQIISIWLPHLAINRWQRQAPDDAVTQPVVLTAESAHGSRITALNAEASKLGAQQGQRLADARALAPELLHYEADPDGDRQALERLALWTQRWAPWSMVDGPDALLLDATGATHLWGGAERLLEMIAHRFETHGLDNRCAMAATAGAAWALSHYSGQGSIADTDDPMLHLRPLPVAALRLEGSVLTLLRRLGLKTIGQLHKVPRDSLARRFRDHRNPRSNPLIRLDQLLGRVPEPMLPILHEYPPRVSRQLLEPILHRSLLDQIVSDLVADMVTVLEGKRLGIRRLEMRAYRIDGRVIARILELASASRDTPHIIKLFSAKLDNIDAGFGIDQVDLISTWSVPMDLAQAQLDDEEAKGTTLTQFVDRIAARLGPAALQRPIPHASYIPERAVKWASAAGTQTVSQRQLPFYQRPLKLLDRPEAIAVVYATPEGVPRKFRWRGSLYDITRSEGPERIAPEWWREKSTVRLRDYYRIEDAHGHRYWIYRNGLMDDGRGGAPDWYLHGMFA